MKQKELDIIKAATILFAKFGPKKTTISEIAAEAGIAKGTIYLSFKSKEDIFLAVVDNEIEDLLARLRAVTRQGKTATEKLKSYLKIRFGNRNESKAKHNTTFEIMDESSRFMDLSGPTAKFVQAEISILREIIEFGKEADEFKNQSDLSEVLAIAMLGLDNPWNLGPNGRPLSIDEKADLFLKLVLYGLKNEES